MRLRLVVRRHNLPDAAVVWAIEPSENPTVSQLLEAVNEVIPLESSGDWGLEDYSVEIVGSGANFECLHFQLVRSVLHGDDEILIRPLLSHDLKLRKVSGRHQITSDGRHLFDGWVFGRPRPRGPIDRPAVEIPPRKRRRITYDEDADSSLDENPLAIEGQAEIANGLDGNRQLILSANFDDDDDDEEDDEDFEPADDDEEEEEDDDNEENYNEKVPDEIQGKAQDVFVVNGLYDEADGEDMLAHLQDADLSLKLQNLRKAFPKAPLSLCENVLVGCDDDVGEAWDTLSQAFKAFIPRKAMNERPQDQETHGPEDKRSKNKASRKTKRLSLLGNGDSSETGGEGAAPPLVEGENLLLEFYDQHGLPEGSVRSGRALSHMADIVSSSQAHQSGEQNGRSSAMKTSISSRRGARSVSFADGNSGANGSGLLAGNDSDDSDDEDFDLESSVIEPEVSGDDSSDESSDSDEGQTNNDVEPTSSDDSDNNSSGSISDSASSSDSDQEPEEISSRQTDLKETATSKTNPALKGNAKDRNVPQRETVPPGQGKSSTRNRNQRRRRANAIQRFKNTGILPAGTTAKDMEQLGLSYLRPSEDSMENIADARTGESQTPKGLAGNVAAKVAEFETKRQQLLDSLASGGVEVGSQLFPKASVITPLGPVSKQAGVSRTTPTYESAESEAPLTPAVHKDLESIANGNTESNAMLPDPATVTNPVDSRVKAPFVSTESSTAGSASRPRRKIDLGAAGRLLFGALGVRAPKSKADHEKVRNDLIKDIRPSKPVPSPEVARTEIESSKVDEDPEAWREVINLRAVECCHDGVELSPAPFPFVQRWDPQQQTSYPKRSNRGGKRKRSQRNQSQYYDDEQQSSMKRKRTWNSYDEYDDPNEEFPGEDACEVGNSYHYDEAAETEPGNAPGTQIVSGGSTEGAVDDQIMRDFQEAATSQATDEDDLPSLPEDVSMLPNLTDDDVKPGMVIAFKQLILSAATNWQPQMSSYRTAVIIKSSDNANLELRLARRDREQFEKHFDEETGERIYGKFDMPTDDDEDDEDEGFLEVTISEMVEPKIVQLALESLSVPELSPAAAQNKTNTSTDDSTTLRNPESTNTSKASFEVPRETDKENGDYQDPAVDEIESASMRGGHLQANNPDEMTPFSISEDTRDEISVLIKEAGFRTSIPSSVLRAQAQLPVTPRSSSAKGPYSPRFNGFDSSTSQPEQALSSPSNFNTITVLTKDTLNAVESAEHVLEGESATPNIQYPKISVPSSLASQVSDLGRQPDYPVPGDDTINQYEDMDSFLGIHEDLPPVRNRDLPSAGLVNSRDSSPLNNIASSPPEYLEPSSGDLPTLDEVFSTARSSIGPKAETQPWLSQRSDSREAKKIEESYNREMEALDAMLEDAEDAETSHEFYGKEKEVSYTKTEDAGDDEKTTPKASQTRRKKKSPMPPVSRKENGSQFKVPTGSRKESGSQFVIPPGSQQVDLTLSSDLETGSQKENLSDGSLYQDDYSLPRGPGWVEKKTTRRTRRQTTGNSQASSSQRVTKTRAARRKTMSRF